MILVGTGGHGADWCQRILPPFVDSGRIEVVAAVDIAPEALLHAQRHLQVPPERCYTDLETALAAHEADFCSVVVPPEAHEQVIAAAFTHGMHVLCEKPLAETLPACVRVAARARAAGRKLGVTMNHRFDQDKTTLRNALASGRYGALDYLVYRFNCNFRQFPHCGATRHAMGDPLLVDAGVHHLDILADLAGARCELVFAQTWSPPWAEFAGDCQALVTMSFANGVRATYEGTFANAVPANCWADEYVRAECEEGVLVLDHRRLLAFGRTVPAHWGDWRDRPEGPGVELALAQRPTWEHAWLLEQFLDWLEGGPAMDTDAESTLESIAVMFAAIESGRTGAAVRVGDLLADARRRAGEEPALARVPQPAGETEHTRGALGC